MDLRALHDLMGRVRAFRDDVEKILGEQQTKEARPEPGDPVREGDDDETWEYVTDGVTDDEDIAEDVAGRGFADPPGS